jgi:hypothetical protein
MKYAIVFFLAIAAILGAAPENQIRFSTAVEAQYMGGIYRQQTQIARVTYTAVARLTQTAEARITPSVTPTQGASTATPSPTMTATRTPGI